MLGKIEIVVEKGDITLEKADAIVNPANSLMIMGGGVALAIKRRGGGIIEKEAIKKAPVPVGKAIHTTAGRLNAKYVIHAPTMERPAQRIPIDNVKAATRAALEVADKLNIESIAFPGMGTGVGGVPEDEAAKAMVETIIEFAKDYPETSIKKVVLVAFTDSLYTAFRKAVESAHD